MQKEKQEFTADVVIFLFDGREHGRSFVGDSIGSLQEVQQICGTHVEQICCVPLGENERTLVRKIQEQTNKYARTAL